MQKRLIEASKENFDRSPVLVSPVADGNEVAGSKEFAEDKDNEATVTEDSEHTVIARQAFTPSSPNKAALVPFSQAKSMA